MQYYKILVVAFLIALGTVLVGCGDTGGDATDEPVAEMTEDMEMTEEADG